MTWRIKGRYVATCSCRLICPCPVDGIPTGSGDTCDGVACFAVTEGDLDGLDLSGANFALVNHFPSNLSSGNWKLGLVVDESASDEQADAITRIVSGQEGGPFADFAPLVSENLGVLRAKISASPTGGSIAGMSEFTYEQLTGPAGGATRVQDAYFAFAPSYMIGKTSGTSNVFGISFQSSYGEMAEFEYSSEAADLHPRG